VNDDYASIREVVSRRYREAGTGNELYPDVILIDGGLGQLHAAMEAFRELNVKPPMVISLAKKDEEVFVLGRSDSMRLSRRSAALRTLQQARDEAHRFAVTFNRARRSARTLTSELLRIPGIGPTRRRALLRAFGSLQGVREASPEAIAAVPGFSLASATRLLRSLQPTSTAASDAPAPTEDVPPPAAPGSSDPAGLPVSE